MTDKDGIWLSKLYHNKSAKFTYTFNPNVLHFEKNLHDLNFIFKTDPGKEMHIYTPSLKLENGKRPVPGLIWKFKQDNLSLYAYKEFKGLDTELFKAPFMNTNKNVCIGSAKIEIDPDSNFDLNKNIESIKAGFFNSAFSHISGTPTACNFHELSEELFYMESFPESVLLPVIVTSNSEQKHITLKDII